MPWGIALDEENNVYVADWGNNRVQKFSPEGEFLMAFDAPGDGERRRPSGVAIDRGGDVYVADWGNDRVQVFDPLGTYQLKFTGDATLSAWGLRSFWRAPSSYENGTGPRSRVSASSGVPARSRSTLRTGSSSPTRTVTVSRSTGRSPWPWMLTGSTSTIRRGSCRSGRPDRPRDQPS